jgi:DNA-binding GntR family transcriptional regulator
LRPLSLKRAGDSSVEALRLAILTGDLAPGQRL